MAKFTNEFDLDVTPFLRGLANIKEKVAKLGKLDANVKVDVDDTELNKAEADIKALDGKTVNVKVDADTDKASKGLSKFGGLASGVLGGLAGGAALQGITALTGQIVKGAEAGDALGDSLEVAFAQAGIADVEGAIRQTTEANLELANSLGQDVARVDELSVAAAGLAGAAGSVNKDMTKAALGIEQLSGGAVKGEAVIKALSRGLADPEGAAAIENLAKKYPQLAETLRGTGDAASKLQAINKELGPTFATLEEQASGPDAVLQQLKNTLSRSFQDVGKELFTALAPVAKTLTETLTPLIQNLAPAIGGIVASLAPLLQSLASQLAPVIASLGNTLAPVISNLVKGLIPLVEGVLPVFVGLLQGVGPLVGDIAGIVGEFVGELSKGLRPAFDAIAKVLPQVLNGLRPLLKTLGGSIGPLIGKLALAFADLVAAILPLIPPLVDVLVPILQVLVQQALIPLRVSLTLVAGVLDLVAKAVAGTIQFFKDLFTSIVDGAKNIPILGEALAFLPKIIESVKQAFSQLVASLPDFVKEILGIEKANEAVVKSTEETTDAVDAQTNVVNANTNAANANTKAKTTGAKATETALQKATKAYQAEVASIKQANDLLRARIEIDKARGVISEKLAKFQLEDINKQEIADQTAAAKRIFDAEVDSRGFFIKTGLKFNKGEVDTELQNIFKDLAVRGANTLEIDVIAVDRTPEVLKAVEEELGSFEPPPLIDEDALLASVDKITTGINAEVGSIAFNKKLEDDLKAIDISAIVGEIFSKGTQKSNEELDAQAKVLQDSLKSQKITYQKFTEEIGLLQEEQNDKATTLGLIFDSLGAGISTGLGVAIANLKDAYAELSKGIEDGSATITDSLKLVGTEGALQFAKLVSEGENLGTAILKSAAATAQKLIAIYSAEIVGLFTATIPPPFGFIAGTAAVAGLNALLAAATQGFEEGGFTGGRPGEVRGIVHGAEYVANASVTKREGKLLKFLDAGGTSEQYYKQFVANNQPKQTSHIANTGIGQIAGILTDVRDRLDRIPNESFMKHGVDVNVGMDTYLYERSRHRARIRGLR